MIRKLYPYQEKMVTYLKENKMAALYAEMRLGKCISTIRALKDIPGRKLIICPKSVIQTWCDELEMEGISDYLWFSSEFLKRTKGCFFPIDLPPWFVVNYEAVIRFTPWWMDHFKHIVVDESVQIKNPQAKLTKFLLENFQNAERKILLSGNPAPNTPLEYFSQMQFLHGRWMNCDNWWQFRRRYFTSDMQGWQWWTRNSSKEVIKLELKKTCFFLSRKEVGVENKKVYERRVVEMPKTLRKEYDRMEKEFCANLPNGNQLETKYVLPQLLYLQEMASGHCRGQKFSNHKIQELVTLLEGELQKEQVLVWCRFRWEIEAIYRLTKSEVIQGDTPIGIRKILQDKFNKGEIKVLVLQIQTSRYGLNLAGGSTAVYFSNTFSSDDRTQSEARIESNSKTEPLLYIDLVTKDSIDEDILKALTKKKKDAKYFMEGIVEEIKKRHA